MPTRVIDFSYMFWWLYRICIRACPAPSGTQCVDSNSGHMKKGAFGVNAKHVACVDAHIRVYQWNHWIRSEDRWAAWVKVLQFCNETMEQ